MWNKKQTQLYIPNIPQKHTLKKQDNSDNITNKPKNNSK